MITVNITGEDFDVTFSAEGDAASKLGLVVAYAMNAIVDHVADAAGFKEAFQETVNPEYWRTDETGE